MEFLNRIVGLPVIKAGMIATMLLTCSCSQSIENKNTQAKKNEMSKTVFIKKPPSSFSDTVIVDCEG